MKKNLPIILFISLALLFGIVSYQYLSRLLPKGEEKVGEETKQQDTTGSIDVSETQRVDDTSLPFKEAVLNKIWVEDLKTQGEAYQLTFGFIQEGIERKVTVSLIGEVYYGELVGENEETGYVDKGLSKVSEIVLEKGRLLTLSVAYIPTDKNSEDLDTYCKDNNYPICDTHPTFGFGQNPINFDEYFKKVYEVNGTMDLSYVAVTAIVKSHIKVE